MPEQVWVIQTRLANDEWETVGEVTEVDGSTHREEYKTKQEASNELKELFVDMDEAGMDYDKSDWRVQKQYPEVVSRKSPRPR